VTGRTKVKKEDKPKPNGLSPAKEKKEPAEPGSEALSEDDELTKRGHD
jgi:hypothetical protein